MAVTISVVITTFNRAVLLEQTLRRMRAQAFEPSDEVIVVDNASTDRTPVVIETAARDFPVTLRYFRECEPGKTPALNTGIGAAQGNVLALTDDDVLVADDWITSIRALFSDPSIDLAGGRVDPLWESPPPRWLQVEDSGQYTEMASPLALQHYGVAQPLGARTAVGANLIVRRRSYDALGGFAEHLALQSPRRVPCRLPAHRGVEREDQTAALTHGGRRSERLHPRQECFNFASRRRRCGLAASVAFSRRGRTVLVH